MSRYSVNIEAQLKGFEEIQAKLKSLETKPINVKVNIDGLNNDLLKQLNSFGVNTKTQFTNIGSNIGNQILGGLSGKISGSSKEFAQAQANIIKKTSDLAKSIKPDIKQILPDISDRDVDKYADQIAKKFVSSSIKANEKAYEQIKKQQEFVDNEYWKRQFKSMTETPAGLKELNADYREWEKSSRQEYEKIQKQQQQLNNAYWKNYFQSMTETPIGVQALNEYYREQEKISQIQAKENLSQIAQAKELANFQKRLYNYYDANTKMHSKYGNELQTIANQSKSSSLTRSELKSLETQFAQLQTKVVQEGLTGKSWISEAKRAAGQIGQFALTYGGIQRTMQAISNSIGELKEIDSILTEISKTSDLTDTEIKQLGVDAFDAASKWGKTASDYLLGIQEMSRSGFYGESAEQMADLSLLAQAAGDLSAEMANNYILASNAAYQYQGNVEKLNAVLDGQNMITNRNSVSMQDMAEATTRAASIASELGVQEDQLSAMIGAVESRTKAGGDEVGNAIKSLLINVTNLNNEKIAATFEKANVAQTEFINGVEKMRNPIDILEDLSKVFNSLEESDPLRNEILMNIGQKYQANKLSALLSGWSDYEKMLQDYSEGTGSAAVEAEKSANNWEGSVNKLSNAFTGLVQNFANSDGIIIATNALTGLIKVVDSLTSGIGILGTALGGFALFKGAKSFISNFD